MFLRQSTSQDIRFGPCLDIGDGVTEETALTLAQADMRLSKDGGAFAQKNAAGNATHDSDGWYSTTLNTTDTNTVGELILNVHQPANMLPVWQRYWVLEEAVYDALFGASAAGFDSNQRVNVGQWLSQAVTLSTGNLPDVNVAEISDDSTAADNAELMFDGTGYAGGTTKLGVDIVSVSGDTVAADNLEADYDGTGYNKSASTIGTTTTNTDMRGTDNAALASVLGALTDAAAAGDPTTADTVMQYVKQLVNVLVGTAGIATWPASAAPANAVNIAEALRAVYDDTNSLDGTKIPDTISLANINAEADTALTDFFTSSAQLVDDVWDEVLSGATHNVTNSAGRRLRFLQESGSYAGAIWIDTVNGTAGTTSFENGTDTNPVDTIADANTLATALGISIFRIAPGSTITLAATQNNQVFIGNGWTLALGGQDIVGSSFYGATVSGVAAGTGTRQDFVNCHMEATSHIKGTHLLECHMAGTQTVVEAGDYFLDNCFSAEAGTGTWIWDFGGLIGNTNLNMRHYSGGVQLENMGDTGTDTASIEGFGQIIEGTCTGGTVAVRGNFTTSGITNLTLSDDARIDVAQINAQVDSALDTAIPGSPTANSINERIAAIDDLTQAAGGGDLAAILADTNELQGDWADGGRLDLILDARASQTTADAIETDTQDIQSRLPAALVGGRIDATVDGTGMESGAIDAILQRQITESYNTDGTAPTVEQALMLIAQMLTERSVSGTTMTVKKLDGTTTALTLTLDDGSNPTSITRAT